MPGTIKSIVITVNTYSALHAIYFSGSFEGHDLKFIYLSIYLMLTLNMVINEKKLSNDASDRVFSELRTINQAMEEDYLTEWGRCVQTFQRYIDLSGRVSYR